jgi:hypothetical protein
LPQYKGCITHNHDVNLVINPYTSNRDGKIYYDGGIGQQHITWFEEQGVKDNPCVHPCWKYKEESRFTLEKSLLDSFTSNNYKRIINFTMTLAPIPYAGAPHNQNNIIIIPVSNTYNPSISPELYVFSFTTVVETFSKCLEKVREKISSEFWKTIEYCPLINIMDLLILKHSDTDKHIEHLEEIIKSLIDDSKLLQTKINTLESQMNLFKTKIPVAVAISKCGEKTVAEEILNE